MGTFLMRRGVRVTLTFDWCTSEEGSGGSVWGKKHFQMQL